MPGRQNQAVVGNNRDRLFYFGEQFAIARDRDERPILFRIANLVFRVERRHPDHPPPSSLHLGHIPDRGWIDAAHRQVQVDAAKDLDSGYHLANQVGHGRGGLIVVLQDQSAHTTAFRQAGEIDCVDRPR